MNRSLTPVIATLVLIALVAGLASCQETEEEPSQQATDTPTASASAAATPSPTAGLPPAAEGYEWFVTPENGAFDYGLPLYAVQIPKTYVRTPAGPYYGNPEQFIPGDTTAFSTRIIVRLTPADAVVQVGFQFELPWQGGGLCGFIPDGQLEAAMATWNLYQFTCPETETGYCTADDQKTTINCVSGEPGVPLSTFDGRAAETRVADFVYSIIVFQPGSREDAEEAFQQAVSTFSIR